MSFTWTQIQSHLVGLGHGSTLNKIRNIEELAERTASIFLTKCKPLETMRTAALSSTIWDDVYNYALPSDYNSLIDLIPQNERQRWDMAYRRGAGQFDIEKAIKEKTVSIEGSEGSKIIRINWRSRSGKVLNAMDSTTANGTWSAVTGASGVQANTIFKVTGNASIEFDLTATGGGIQNTTMTAVDLADEDEVADFFVWVYLPSTSITSVAALWGNDLTTNFWTSVVQTTQADGTAFKVGWNLIKFPWSTATETGTVAPATIDSFRLTINGSTAINNMRVDSIICTIGRNFDIKYYSKYLFKNTGGTYLSKPASGDDTVLVDNDSLPIYLFELLDGMAQQVEGTDAAFDISYAEKKLAAIYPNFKAEYPDQRKKLVGQYGTSKHFNRLLRRL